MNTRTTCQAGESDSAGRAWCALAMAVSLAAGPVAGQTSIVVNNVYQVDGSGSPTENCAALKSTLAGIALGTSDRALVRLEPGFYNCGTSGVMMRDRIDVEGAGRGITWVEGNVDSSTDPSPLAVVELVDIMELRNVSVVNYSDPPLTTPAAIAYQGDENARLRNVGALARPGINGSIGILHKGAGFLHVVGSDVEGGTNGMFITEAGQRALVTYSRLQMGVAGTGTAKCLYSYFGDDPLLPDCVTLAP